MTTLMTKAIFLSLLFAVPGAQASPKAQPMERVSGLGGFFFKSKDPKALADWYEKMLGVSKVPATPQDEPWMQEKGPTAFAPFPENSEMLGKKPFMLNFRVQSLDRMVKQLRDAGVKVEVDATEYPYGRFATLEDPEGNPIQLWQPK